MRFWDSSALVPLFIDQPSSRQLRGLHSSGDEILAWTLSEVELRSAIARLSRDSALTSEEAQEALIWAESLWESVNVVAAVDAVKLRAKRLLDRHPLRAADALQLGSALTATNDEPLGREFVCLDERLASAARAERFTVLP